MMAARAASSVDLFVWREVADARAAAEAAQGRRERAAERYRYAPRGEILNRLRAFQEATEEALRAGLALAEAARKSLH
ncbi:MAG: hypothetical protein ACR2F8_02975 [Caulobacteraceae bacterium]